VNLPVSSVLLILLNAGAGGGDLVSSPMPLLGTRHIHGSVVRV
jgi:hypothetical protein